MYDGKIYWVWLQQCLGYANSKIKTVRLLYDKIEDFYNSGVEGWKNCGCFSKKELDLLSNSTFSKAKDIVEKCKELSYEIITIEDDNYPNRLKNIDDPPCVLYVKGKLSDIDNNLCISVVGTRNATDSGIKTSYKLGFELAKAGAIVVSGGALGIDCASQKGALYANGVTIAVLACGINYQYLAQNAPMRNDIAKTGAIISEYPPDIPPLPRNFPIRNRIIAALSVGTVVVEAGEKSGALITVKHALDQNKDVFAVPGSIQSSVSYGTNELIKLGAKPVTCVEDILEEYRHLFKIINCEENIELPLENIKVADITNNNYINTINANEKKSKEIKPTEEKTVDKDLINKLSKETLCVYNALSYEPKHIDEISLLVGMNIQKVLKAITELEIYGLLDSYSGRRYSKPQK